MLGMRALTLLSSRKVEIKHFVPRSKACNEGLSAEATIDRLLEAVSEFKGSAVQPDDMTCVVVRVEDTAG